MPSSPDLAPTLALLQQLPSASREVMVRMYRQALRDHLDQIGVGLQAGANAPDGVGPAHRIAGSAGMMQDMALCEAARAIESALREGRNQDAQALLPRLHDCAQATLAALALAYPGVE